jgi:hypothetical protein
MAHIAHTEPGRVLFVATCTCVPRSSPAPDRYSSYQLHCNSAARIHGLQEVALVTTNCSVQVAHGMVSFSLFCCPILCSGCRFAGFQPMRGFLPLTQRLLTSDSWPSKTEFMTLMLPIAWDWRETFPSQSLQVGNNLSSVFSVINATWQKLSQSPCYRQ